MKIILSVISVALIIWTVEAQSVPCPLIRCATQCQYGYLYDANGCQTCQCYENPCNRAICEPGSVCHVEQVVCVTVPCYPQANCVPCPLPLCIEGCQFGYQNDANGCQTCKCKVNPCSLILCTPGTVCQVQGGAAKCVLCPLPLCKEACPYGYENGANGCPTCQCKVDPCSVVRCASGTVCEVHGGSAKCVPVCPLIKCSQPCPYGYKTDEKGCQTCTCMDCPCKNHKCDKGEVCEVQKVVCITTPCYPVANCVEPCSLPKDVGPCDGTNARYYYNSATKRCSKFTYGGCEGNANNFETLRACRRTCKKKRSRGQRRQHGG